MIRYLVFLVLLAGASHAHAQYAECDPLNSDYIYTVYDAGLDYPSLEAICTSVPKPIPINNCGQIGAAFVTYSDATLLSDGTFQAFAASEDLSKYSATSSVQITTTVTGQNGQKTTQGGYNLHGYVMVHMPLTVNTSLTGDITIASSHELNWPGCDGYGIIIQTSTLLHLAQTNYIFNGMEGSECVYDVYCPNGNAYKPCVLQVPRVVVDGPPVNVCQNYLHDHRLVVDGVCLPVGKAELASTPVDCH